MPNTRLTRDAVRNYVNRKLGASGTHGVAVELDEPDIDEVLGEAVDFYNRTRPQRAASALSISSSQKKYELTHPGLVGIVDLQFVREPLLSGQVDPFDPHSVLHPPVGFGGGETFGSLEQQLGYQEQARQITRSEPEWKALWHTDGKYYVFIDIPQGVTYNCSYTYAWHVTADEHATTGMQNVPDGDVRWIMQYTLALSKLILSKIRGKFHGIPTPDGGEEETDYADLKEEGTAEQEALETELRERRRPLAPLIG